MSYMEKLTKLIEAIHTDTYDMITENEMTLTRIALELMEINKRLTVSQFQELMTRAKVEHDLLRLEDIDLGFFHDDYEIQLQKAEKNIQDLNKICKQYHIKPFYENDLFDGRAVMEFVNTFTHAFADARIKSYYKEKDHMEEKDLTKQTEHEDYMERE